MPRNLRLSAAKDNLKTKKSNKINRNCELALLMVLKNNKKRLKKTNSIVKWCPKRS